MHIVWGLLQIVLIALKLSKLWDGEWWQVLLPAEISATILAIIFSGLGILALLAARNK